VGEEIQNNSGVKDSRPFWKKKRWWVASCIIVLIICIQSIPRFPFGPYTLYNNLTDGELLDKITYEVLTDEKTRPFWNGSAPKYFQNAISKFPHVRSCMVSSEHRKEIIDIRLIDWNRFSNDDDATVCLWRIFTSLNSQENIEKWLKFQGFPERADVKKYGPLYPTRGIQAFLGLNIVYWWEPVVQRDLNGNISRVSWRGSSL
jgi:hypothetical protein